MPKVVCRILDLGGHPQFWRNIGRDFLADRHCQITLYNVHPSELAQVAAADTCLMSSVAGDACKSDFDNDAFDLVHSNSTIEHVGDWARTLLFAEQVRRLAPAYFVQTPNFWFPVEPHCGVPFWHWFPEPLRVSLLWRGRRGHFARAATVSEAVSTIQEVRLLDKRLLSVLFPDGAIVEERFAG